MTPFLNFYEHQSKRIFKNNPAFLVISTQEIFISFCYRQIILVAPQTTVVTRIGNPIGPADVARDNHQPNESNTVSKRKIGLGRRITNKINVFLERGFER